MDYIPRSTSVRLNSSRHSNVEAGVDDLGQPLQDHYLLASRKSSVEPLLEVTLSTTATREMDADVPKGPTASIPGALL